MKRIAVILQIFLVANLSAQDNEFAATAFYNEFKKIHADAQNGFTTCRAAQRKTGYEELQTEYRTRCLLPLADSGKIIIPSAAVPFAIYYFEPNKSRLKVDQLAVNLRDAVVVAYGQPLYSRSETLLVNNYPFTNTLLFADPNEENLKAALFRLCIYYSNGKYYLSFEIRGKK